MDLISKFNTTIKELVRDLINVFPEDSDFQMVQLGLTAAVIADETVVQKKFHEEVSKYDTQILSKDEAFFLNKNYEELQNAGIADRLITKVKSYWQQLDTHNREMVWKYLKVLVLLDRKICAA
jgi:hypothetical protein